MKHTSLRVALGKHVEVVKRPILVDLLDRQWLEELRLVAIATRRTLIAADHVASRELIIDALDNLQPGSAAKAILVTDQDNPLAAHRNVRTLDLRQTGSAADTNVDTLERTLDLRQDKAGAALSSINSPQDLATLIGMHDLPTIAVIGAVGGAGTTIMCAALAQVFAHRNHRVTIVDANAQSWGIDIALGAEQSSDSLGAIELAQNKHSGAEIREPSAQDAITQGAGLSKTVTHGASAQDAVILDCGLQPPVSTGTAATTAAAGTGTATAPTGTGTATAPTGTGTATAPTGTAATTAATDTGTATAATDTGTTTDTTSTATTSPHIDLYVIVTTLTVPGLMYARKLHDHISRATGAKAVAIVRDYPHSDVPTNLAALTLQHRAIHHLPTDAAITNAINTGNLHHILTHHSPLMTTARAVITDWETAHQKDLAQLLEATEREAMVI